MSTEQTHFGHLQTAAWLMIFVGAGITWVFDDVAWLGIAIAVTGLVVSLVMLFIQAATEVQHGLPVPRASTAAKDALPRCRSSIPTMSV